MGEIIPAMVKHLLLDLDGTLVDAHNTRLSWDFVRKMVRELRRTGGSRFRSVRLLAKLQSEMHAFPKERSNLTNSERALQAAKEIYSLSDEKAQELLYGTVREVFPTLQRHFFPVEGASDFVHWAKEHYPLTLVTNPVWPEDIITMRVKWAGLKKSDFRGITHSDVMHYTKPYLEYYQEVLQKHELDPKDCLLIGNERKNDLPATGLGIPVYLIDPDHDGYRSIKTENGTPAWEGNYAGLRNLLLAERS